MIISLDGPAASGKGTIARGIANRLGFEHLDSGLFYRAYPDIVGDGDPGSIDQYIEAFKSISTNALRDERHAQRAAVVASSPIVRDFVTEVIRTAAQRLDKRGSGVVLDGRDIGTVVFPDADVKLFITASVEARANRRYEEMKLRRPDVTLAEIENDLRRRDERDRNREVAPLVPAADAMVIDTSALGKDEAIAAAIEAVEEALGK